MRIALLFLLLAIACAGQSSPAQLSWSPTEIPNVSMAVVSGDSAANSQCVVRLRADRPAQIPPHSFASDKRLTVVSGTPSIGDGARFVPAALRRLRTGESVTLSKGTHHFATLNVGDEIEISGTGPFAFTWVDPKAVKELNRMKNVDSVSERTKQKREQDKP